MPASPILPETGLAESEPRVADTAEGRVAWHEQTGSGAVPPLVLLHGYTGHRDDWIGVLSALAVSRRVLAPDLRGHGDSESGPGPRGWCFDQLVSDVLAFLDALELDRIDLLGHSAGGFVALRLALARPDRVRSLALVCTGPEIPDRMDSGPWRKASEFVTARGMAALQPIAEKVIRAEPFPGLAAWGDPERYYAHHQRRHLSMTPESYREFGRMFFESGSLVDRLPEITLPTLAMVGEQDVDWLPGADLFEQHLDAVRRVTVADAEHHPHQENRAAFLAAVEAHLDRVENGVDAAPGTLRPADV